MTPNEGRTHRRVPVRVPEEIPQGAGERGFQLEAAFHVGGTELRRVVNRLRCDGHPICSADSGYFYAARRLEVRATVAQLTGRISKIAAAAKGLLQSYEETEG